MILRCAKDGCGGLASALVRHLGNVEAVSPHSGKKSREIADAPVCGAHIDDLVREMRLADLAPEILPINTPPPKEKSDQEVIFQYQHFPPFFAEPEGELKPILGSGPGRAWQAVVKDLIERAKKLTITVGNLAKLMEVLPNADKMFDGAAMPVEATVKLREWALTLARLVDRDNGDVVFHLSAVASRPADSPSVRFAGRVALEAGSPAAEPRRVVCVKGRPVLLSWFWRDHGDEAEDATPYGTRERCGWPGCSSVSEMHMHFVCTPPGADPPPDVVDFKSLLERMPPLDGCRTTALTSLCRRHHEPVKHRAENTNHECKTMIASAYRVFVNSTFVKYGAVAPPLQNVKAVVLTFEEMQKLIEAARTRKAEGYRVYWPIEGSP